MTKRVAIQNFNVLISGDSIFFAMFMKADLAGMVSAETIRKYCKLFGDDCELRGHVDTKVMAKSRLEEYIEQL